MKTINNLAKKLNLEVAPLTFRNNGVSRIGFALYSKSPMPGHGQYIRLGNESFPEIFTFEQTFNRDRLWKVIDHRPGGSLRYLKANEFDKIRL